MTQYRVMRAVKATSESQKSAWEYVASHEAASATAAIRAYMKTQGAQAGEYVAVPDRSWKPLTVKIETQTKLTLT